MKTMQTLLISLCTVLLFLLATVACLRFLFRRQGWLWIIPLLISVLFVYLSMGQLRQAATGTLLFSSRQPLFLVIALLWYATIIVFYSALKQAIPEKRYLEHAKKQRTEQRYLERIEQKKQQIAIRKLTKEVSQESGDRYPVRWITLFED